MAPDHSGSSAQALLALRLIGASLGGGVAFFAGVAWFVHQQGGPSFSFGDPAILTNVFVGVALLAALAALAVWRTRVVPLIESPRGDDWTARATRIQTPLIITWAILEAGAMAGAAVYFLYGNPLPALIGLVLMWGGLAATWPQSHWFEP